MVSKFVPVISVAKLQLTDLPLVERSATDTLLQAKRSPCSSMDRVKKHLKSL